MRSFPEPEPGGGAGSSRVNEGVSAATREKYSAPAALRKSTAGRAGYETIFGGGTGMIHTANQLKALVHNTGKGGSPVFHRI